jgi:uncharacterized protein (DUF1800 family)
MDEASHNTADQPRAEVALARRRFLALAAGGVATLATACGPTVPAPRKTANPVPKPTASKPPTTSPKPIPTASPKPTSSASTAPKPTTSATPTPSPKPTAIPSPAPIVEPPPLNLVGTDPAFHLLRRATFGATREALAEVRALGPAAWLEQQLVPASIDDSACDAYLVRYPSLPLTVKQIRAGYPAYDWRPMVELGQASLARALWSRRQLLEVMVEFWNNHFHVVVPGTALLWDVKSSQDRDAIRPHALGTFRDLLRANATSPAMMRYLDNDTNSAKTPNENFGRELLELHTVGLEAGYTQADVVNSSRIVSGFTEALDGTFAFDPSRHNVGPVKVLGFSTANSTAASGMQVVNAYLDYLATHPSTARHLARKLAIRFVSDSPSDALVERMAQTYVANGTAIAPVLRQLFSFDEFRTSIGQKIRRPIEDVVGALRILGAQPGPAGSGDLSGLYWGMDGLGQLPMSWRTPQGFPDTVPAWLSTSGLLQRWNVHTYIAPGWQDGFIKPASSTLLDAGATELGGLIDGLVLRMLGAPLLDTQRTALVTFLREIGCMKPADVTGPAADVLVTVLLDSPQWLQR